MYKQTYHLGSNFIGKTVAQRRQSKLQYKIFQESITSQIESRYFDYWEKTEFLIQFLNKERLEKVVHILAHGKSKINNDELLTTVIVLYEIDLFLETGKTIFTYVINEICNSFIVKKFQKDNPQINNLKRNYFSKVCELSRQIIEFRGISESYDQYYCTKIHNVFLEFYPDQDLYFKIRGPGHFAKILLGHRIIQEMEDYSYSLQTKEFFSEIISPKDIRLLGILFFNQYLDVPSQFKSTNLLSICIIKSIENSLSRQIIQKQRTQYNQRVTSMGIKLVLDRQKKFLNKLIGEFFLERSPTATLKEKIVLRLITFWEFVENINFPFISTICEKNEYKNPLLNFFKRKFFIQTNSFLEWDAKGRRRNK